VLFDAAETLFTTRGSVGEIYASVARQYGSKASPEAIQAAFSRHFRGSGPVSVEDQKAWWKDVVYRVFSDVGMLENFDEFFDRVYATFRDSQGWILFPETLDVLKELKSRGLKLGVISNFDDRVYSVLTSLGIRTFFDTVTISSETGFSKPEPEIFEAAIRALGIPASEIVLVGDSLRDDVEPARRAGLTALHIDRSGRRGISSLHEVFAILPKTTP
jgi:putative hydrolase of the HAD superfamily